MQIDTVFFYKAKLVICFQKLMNLLFFFVPEQKKKKKGGENAVGYEVIISGWPHFIHKLPKVSTRTTQWEKHSLQLLILRFK